MQNLKLNESLDYIKSSLGSTEYPVAMILGSGLSYLSEEMENKTEISTASIPHYPKSTVAGHKGAIIAGTLAGKLLLIMSGRVHFYEGYTPEEVVYPINVLKGLGVQKLILTNAAGGINSSFIPGDLMILTGFINKLPFNPRPDQLNSNPFSTDLNRFIQTAAQKIDMAIKSGIYTAMTGPSFETPAEIRYLKTIGSDAVGMSTVPEALMADYLKIEVAAISCISNLAAGISGEKLTHEEVQETADKVKGRFLQLLKELMTLI